MFIFIIGPLIRSLYGGKTLDRVGAVMSGIFRLLAIRPFSLIE